jgi:hypothetical protein
MKALKMFKKQGYKCTESLYDIEYVRKDNIKIVFYKGDKEYAVIDGDRSWYCRVSMKTNQAIHQQLKELGWIK